MLMNSYTSIFFTDFLGISAGLAGTIFMFSRFWDAINDPMCGILVERSNPRHGKVQTWMFFGGILAAASLIMLFTIPELSQTGRTIWGTVAYNIFGMAFTAVTVAALLQMPRGTDQPKEQIHMNMSYTIGCSLTGIIVASFITNGLQSFGAGNAAKGYQTVALLTAVVGLAFVIGSVFTFRDQTAEIEASAHIANETPRISDMLKAVLKVPSFFLVVLGSCIANLGMSVMSSSLLFYLTYVLEAPEKMAILLPVIYVGTLIGSLLAGPLARFDKKKMMIISLLIQAAGPLLRIVTADSGISMYFGYAIMCIGNGLLITFLNPCLVDCADYAEYKTGIKCQGLSLTGCTLVSKMTMGIGTAVVGFGLDLGGYISSVGGNAVTQPQSAKDAIYTMQFWPTVIAAVIGIVLLLFYKLDDETMEKVYAAKKAKLNNRVE